MARLRLWPSGFIGRVTVVLVLAVLVQFLAASLLIRASEAHIHRQDLGQRIAEQLLIAERIILTAEPGERDRLLKSLSTIHTRLSLIEGPQRQPPRIDPDAAQIADAIFAFEPSLADHPMRLTLAAPSRLGVGRDIDGAIEIQPGVWIAFHSEDSYADWTLLETPLRIGIVALFVLGSAAMLVHTLNAPLRRLAFNAQAIGTPRQIRFDEQTGPQELREVSHALNAMQDRLEGVINQRTQALLAVGHDLRTPLARLRLRLQAIGDEQDREAAMSDIGQMTRMLQELIDFFETGESVATREPIDLSSLCQTISEAFADQGAEVDFDGPDRLVIEAVHDHVTRAIENLVDNAVKYAGSACIGLAANDDQVRVTVADRGPGIAADQIDRLMRPFERLEASRSGRHPGMGLGLSIADNVARAHGGRLDLLPRDGGGLLAILIFSRK